jgi:hypothetical protein
VTTGDGATVVVVALPTVVVVVRGAVVVVGVGTVSIVTDEALTPDTGPVMPDADTASAAIRATTVPSDEHTTDTVTLEPDEPDGVNTHPVAVPVLEKSPAAIPVTLLLNTSVYDNVRDDDGDDGSVHDTVGTSVSIVTDEALTPDTGPVMPEAETASAAIRATTVPSDEHTTDTVALEPDEPDGVNTHPVAVPVLEKSPAAIPVTLLLKTSV